MAFSKLISFDRPLVGAGVAGQAGRFYSEAELSARDEANYRRGVDATQLGRAVGVADDKSGEAVKLVIVRKDPSLTVEQIKAHCKDNLTGYKQPKIIEFRDSLPKTNVGKILRRELRDAAKPSA